MIPSGTVVIGLGNPLMSDEGIGVYLVNELERRGACPGVCFEDMGTSGTRILHKIANKARAVFVDCAFMGEEPGTMRAFTPEDVASVKKLGHFSTHESDLLVMLELSRLLGECPPQITIFGIEPQSLAQGSSLSPLLAAEVESYLEEITKAVLAPA